MAADLIYSTDLNNVGSDDLTLTAQNNGGTLALQLLRTSNMSQVVSVNLDDSGDVNVNVRREQTTAGDIDPFADTLRIDLNSLNLINSFVVANGGVLSINFEGGIELPGIGEDHLFLASTGTANIGFGLSVITTADITPTMSWRTSPAISCCDPIRTARRQALLWIQIKCFHFLQQPSPLMAAR